MRINLAHNQRCTEGNVLVVSLVISGFLGLVLAGYLTLVAGQNKATMRSLAWGSAMPIAEAGIEEAMTQVNANGTNLVANNNWTLVDGNYFIKWLMVGENRYLAGFFNSTPPVLVSQGFTRLPLGTNMISRTVVVRTRLAKLFTKGMVGLERINLNGNDINVDSFDSMDPNHSMGGRYDSTKKKDNGAIATNSALTNSLDAGNAKIRGKIATGPGGIPKLGPNSSVGSNSWVNAGNIGIQPGACSDDMNASFYDVDAPFTSALPPTGGSDGAGNSYDYVLGDGNWMISSPLSFGGNVIVTGNAVLLVTSDVQFSGQDFIRIQPNASLKLYVSAPTAFIGGNGVENETGNAINFAYYGLPSNTKVTFAGNATVVGTLYAPQADFTLGGGGSTDNDFVGASVTKTVTMNGHFNFHYDENLERAGPNRGWVAISWDETPITWQQIRARNLGPADL